MICWGSTLHRGESEIPSPESKWGDYHPKPDEVAPFDWAEPAADGTALVPTIIVEEAAAQNPVDICGCFQVRLSYSNKNSACLASM